MDIKKKTGDLKYVITSHPKYSKALEHLLDSMYVAGVSPSDIIVILGDCDTSGRHIKEKINYRPGISYIPIENNLYEFNFFIGIMKAIELGVCRRIDNFVLIHDTCIVGNNFKQATKRFSRRPEQILWNNKSGHWNIGVFKYSAIKEGRNLYKSLKTISKHEAIQMELNHHHWSPKRFPVSQYFKRDLRDRTVIKFCKSDVYSEGRERTLGLIPSMDIIKFYLWVPHGNSHPNQIDD